MKAISLVLCLACAFLLLNVEPDAAQESQVVAAPIPPQILNAKTVFIGNGGNQSTTEYSGGPDRPYNAFYAAIKIWGRYLLVSSPADADLLLEIHFVLPAVPSVPKEPMVYDPQLRVIIREPKTHALLWTVIEHADWAMLKSNRDKNFDAAMGKLVTDLQALVNQPANPSNK
jgi:hypothetical protein